MVAERLAVAELRRRFRYTFGTDQILRNPRKKQVTLADIVRSPTTLKVCNLLATVAAAWLFQFVLVRVPEMRQQREIARAAAARADAALAATLYQASRARVEAKDWIAAETLTRRLVDRDPENHEYLKQLATALRELGRRPDEAVIWERYMRVAPDPLRGCPMIAEAWQAAGNAERALVAWERCYQLSPQETDWIFFLARSYERSRRPRDAATLYRKGMQLAPGYADMAVGLGRTELALQRPESAEALARAVLAKSPDYPDALLVLGMALRELGRLDEATAALERGLAISPRYSDFQYVLGRIAEDRGNRDEAIRWYRESLAISPDRTDSLARLAAVEGGGAK